MKKVALGIPFFCFVILLGLSFWLGNVRFFLYLVGSSMVLGVLFVIYLLIRERKYTFLYLFLLLVVLVGSILGVLWYQVQH